MLKKKTIDDFLQELEQAREWLNIDRGRAREYVRLLEEYGRGERRPEHVLAYYEAYDIVELFQLWGLWAGLHNRPIRPSRERPAKVGSQPNRIACR